MMCGPCLACQACPGLTIAALDQYVRHPMVANHIVLPSQVADQPCAERVDLRKRAL